MRWGIDEFLVIWHGIRLFRQRQIGARAGVDKKMRSRFIERQQPVFQENPVRLGNFRGMVVSGVLRPGRRARGGVAAGPDPPVADLFAQPGLVPQHDCRAMESAGALGRGVASSAITAWVYGPLLT